MVDTQVKGLISWYKRSLGDGVYRVKVDWAFFQIRRDIFNLLEVEYEWVKG
jgi:hypothetical protein